MIFIILSMFYYINYKYFYIILYWYMRIWGPRSAHLKVWELDGIAVQVRYLV